MTRKKRTPGGNRTDLLTQKVQVPTGLPYGQATQLRQAQQAQPLPDERRTLDLAANTPPPPPITAPTNLPGEPLTAGLASGPGPGPEVLPASPGMSPLDQIRALVRVYPDESLIEMLRYAEQNP